MHRRAHNQNGATMGFLVVCSLILALLTVGLFQVTMIFGGSQELRNSIDAGTLNVGKKTVTLTTTPGASDEKQFDDCVDTRGEIGLLNINRVLGKSFLMAANEQAMSSQGHSTGTSGSHAASVATAAQQICDRVTARLKNPNETHPFFESFIKANSIKMFGKSAEVKADNDQWEAAYVDRDEESNLKLAPEQMPDGYNLPNDATKDINEKTGGSVKYFRGYHGVSANSAMHSFVPFKYDEKPHLINGFYFQASKIPVPNWMKPVPNALSCKGSTDKMSWNNSATAWVVSNPQQQYWMAMPHSFIKIKLEKNKAIWKYQGLITDKTTTYGYYPGQVQFHIRDAGSGTMNITATLGMEYVTMTMLQAINALGTPENDATMKLLLQRCREIKHDFTMADLHTLLLQPGGMTAGLDEGTFYIFPTYTTADKTDPKLTIQRESIAKGMAPWLKSADADGDEYESNHETRPLFSSPNIVIMTLTGLGCKPGIFGSSEIGELNWTPGTGYDGCLGTLRLHRETTIYYSGYCTIL